MIHRSYAGREATLDGTTITLAVMGPDYTPSFDDDLLDDIAAYEVSTDDAPGYARSTFPAVWTTAVPRLDVGNEGRLAGVFDLDGATVGGYVIADDDGVIIADFPLTAPAAGYDGWPVTFMQGVLGPVDFAELLGRLAQVEARTVAGVAAVAGDYPAPALAEALAGFLPSPSGGLTGWAVAVEADGVCDIAGLAAASPASVYGALITSEAPGTVEIVLPDPTGSGDLRLLVSTGDQPLDTMAEFEFTFVGDGDCVVVAPPDLTTLGQGFVAWPQGPNWLISPIVRAQDVSGPGSSGDGHVALFDGTSGRLLADGGATGAAGLAVLAEATEAGARTALGLGGAAVVDVDTDVHLAGDSDTKVPSQKAVRAHASSFAAVHRSGTAGGRRISTYGPWQAAAIASLAGVGYRSYAPIFLPAGTYQTLHVYCTAVGDATWRLGLHSPHAADPTRPGAVHTDAGVIDLSIGTGLLGFTGLNMVVPHDAWFHPVAQVETYSSNPSVAGTNGTSSAPWGAPILGFPGDHSSYLRSYFGYLDQSSSSAGALAAANAVTGNPSTGLAHGGYIPRFWIGA